MTIYQKAIKVRKTCEDQKDCRECPYYGNCKTSDFLFFSPVEENIQVVTKAIKEEKWNVK